MSQDTKFATTREKIIAANQIYATYPLFNRVLEDIYECHYSPETNADKYLSKINCIFFDKVLGAHFEVVAISHFL